MIQKRIHKLRSEMRPRLQVMKFGGTSVGDAECIARTAQIVAKAAKENPCIAVVSAVSGVTNRLIEAARKAQPGDTGVDGSIVGAVRLQHEPAMASLGQRPDQRAAIELPLEEARAEGQRHWQGTLLHQEL